MAAGSLVHALVLAPDEAAQYVRQDWDGRTSSGKARAAEVLAGGLTALSRDDYDRAALMALHAAEHPVIREGLRLGQAERELRWSDDAGQYGGRADLVVAVGSGEVWIWDLKTTRDASGTCPQRECMARAYYGQLAYYRWGLCTETGLDPEAVRCGLLWVDEVGARAQELDRRWLDMGDSLVSDLLELRQRCEAAGSWPAYGDEVETMAPPGWAWSETEDTEGETDDATT